MGVGGGLGVGVVEVVGGGGWRVRGGVVRVRVTGVRRKMGRGVTGVRRKMGRVHKRMRMRCLPVLGLMLLALHTLASCVSICTFVLVKQEN
jgi:hypothetical protein